MTDLERATTAGRDPVAVVGVGLRLPGADDAGQLWTLLREGRDAVGEIPDGRFDLAGWSPDGRDGRRVPSRAGAFLDRIDEFDAAFFGMSAHEAERLDPQHRLMLETVWEALEDAGTPAESLAGSRTGVYTACLAADYWDTVRAAGPLDMHASIGTGSWGMPSGRISRLLDLRGPSLGVEATCSTGLLAVHLACRDLWGGEADAALVSGANLLTSEELYLGLAEAGILSPRGRCRFGDAGADGYVRAEGVVSILLKPLSRARRDGDRVYACIRGTGVVNNGATSATLISPGRDGQRDTLRRACADAGIDPCDVGYVEAHGAGTPRGDDIELAALSDVFGAGRPPGDPCLVGSVKSNLGHAEAVAGLIGLVKAALVVRHREVPASPHVETLQPRLAAPGSGLEVVRELRPWPGAGPAVAGVSAFGLSATNVHVVLSEDVPEDVPEVVPEQAPAPGRDGSADAALLLPLSARDDAALRSLARAVAERLDDPLGPAAADLCRTAAVRRTHHDRRLAVSGRTGAELAAHLRARASGPVPGRAGCAGRRPRVVFAFAGQGSQYPGMARGLLRSDPVFARRFDECDAAVRAEAGWSVRELLEARREFRDESEVQPAVWAVQVALAALWRSRGIEPDALVGHSMGEVAAATVGGALSVPDAAAVICRRSALVVRRARPGLMLAVGAGEAATRELLAPHADDVEVAATNSPVRTVVAGSPDAIRALHARLRRSGELGHVLAVRYASHTAHMDPLLDELRAELAGVTPRPSSVPLLSGVRCREVDGSELDAAYWADNLREPVRFDAAVTAALDDDGHTVVVDVSPHPQLLPAVQETVREHGARATAVGSLDRDAADDDRTLLAALGAVWEAGGRPDWAAVAGPGPWTSSMPGYPWQRRRHWADPVPTEAVGGTARTVTLPGGEGRPEIGVQVRADGDGWVLEVRSGDADVRLRVDPTPARPEAAAPDAPAASPPAAVTALAGLTALPRARTVSPAAVAAAAGRSGPVDGHDDVAERIARLLGTDVGELDPAAPPAMLGLDSLMLGRLHAWVTERGGRPAPLRELATARTLGEIVERAAGRAGAVA